jgi:hypothetical protein
VNNEPHGGDFLGDDDMRFSTIIGVALFSAAASTAYACDLPKLVAIPPKDQVAGKEAAIRAAASTYFMQMQAYTACVQAELQAAGGDAAPDFVKRVLVSRNNTAVAEAEFMMKLLTENVGGGAAAGGAPAPGAAPAEEPGGRRNRDR